MRYSEVVNQARDAAIGLSTDIIVFKRGFKWYQRGNRYAYIRAVNFPRCVELSEVSITRMLLITSRGVIVQ